MEPKMKQVKFSNFNIQTKIQMNWNGFKNAHNEIRTFNMNSGQGHHKPPHQRSPPTAVEVQNTN